METYFFLWNESFSHSMATKECSYPNPQEIRSWGKEQLLVIPSTLYS